MREDLVMQAEAMVSWRKSPGRPVKAVSIQMAWSSFQNSPGMETRPASLLMAGRTILISGSLAGAVCARAEPARRSRAAGERGGRGMRHLKGLRGVGGIIRAKLWVVDQ